MVSRSVLSERYEEEVKAIEWAKDEQKKIRAKKADRLARELMDRMTPIIMASQKDGGKSEHSRYRS